MSANLVIELEHQVTQLEKQLAQKELQFVQQLAQKDQQIALLAWNRPGEEENQTSNVAWSDDGVTTQLTYSGHQEVCRGR